MFYEFTSTTQEPQEKWAEVFKVESMFWGYLVENHELSRTMSCREFAESVWDLLKMFESEIVDETFSQWTRNYVHREAPQVLDFLARTKGDVFDGAPPLRIAVLLECLKLEPTFLDASQDALNRGLPHE